jgi:hypothetical protein
MFASEDRGWARIDDDNFSSQAEQQAINDGTAAGYVPRDFEADPQAGYVCASPSRAPKVPRDEWIERIKEREAKKQRGIDLIEAYNVPRLHQGQTSSCWIQTVIQNMHLVMASNGGPIIPLSPAFASALIKGFRDVGGNCSEGAKFLHENGTCDQTLWPPNANTSRKFNTSEANENALRHRILEYDDLTPKSFDEMFDELFAGLFVGYGNYTMSHAVLAIDPLVDKKGNFGILTLNSGLYRGPDGLTQFFGSRARPDDAIAVRTITIDTVVPEAA